MLKLMTMGFRNVLRDEEGGAGGDIGGGAGGENGGTSGGDKGGETQDGEELNNLAKTMDDAAGKGDTQEAGAKPKEGAGGAGGEPPKSKKEGGEEQKTEPPTEEEVKAYKEAFKLDEKVFGKDLKFDERYIEKLPAMFKKHGIDPETANKIANDFAAVQRDIDAEAMKKSNEYKAWRAGEMQKMNEAFLEKYDKSGRIAIGRAIDHFFKPGTPMYEIVRRSEVGVDPGFLEAMAFIGERLPASGAPGAASGAGSAEKKGLADSFLGQ